MNWLKNISVSAFAVIFAILLVEFSLQIYVNVVAERGKLFRPNKITGWSTLGNLKISRLNAAGKNWFIETGENGQRVVPVSSTKYSSTLLILGDSFAFGEGVDIEDRFDLVLSKELGGIQIINTGTMGYGTDQQYLSSHRYLEQLQSGDVVLVLFYQNDFYDVLRRRSSLRAKPVFKLADQELVLVPPKITWREYTRDKSYLMSILGRFWEPTQSDHWDFELANEILEYLFSKIGSELPENVSSILAYHGETGDFYIPEKYSGANFCIFFDRCIDLDEHLFGHSEFFLPDGHWTKEGHSIVGKAISSELSVTNIKE